MKCEYCGEPILPQERSPFVIDLHQECAFRMGAGSIAHIEKRCSCYVANGATHLDPPGLTKRQAARAALETYRALHAIN